MPPLTRRPGSASATCACGPLWRRASAPIPIRPARRFFVMVGIARRRCAEHQSEWSNHEIKGDLRLGYADFPQVPKANQPDGTGTLIGRIDVTRDTQVDLAARYTLSTQRHGSPELPA